MALSSARTFFYSPELAAPKIVQIFAGIGDAPEETITFAEETGGEVRRDLAIPLLREMDEIRVTQAELRFATRAIDIETHSYQALKATDTFGTYLSLPKPGLLKKVTLQYVPPAPPQENARLLVRSAQPDGATFKVGVPIFSSSAISGPNEAMYGPALPGAMAFRDLGSNQFQITLPSVLGSAWLFQLATGDEVTNLSPQSIDVQILSVTLDSVPSDVAVLLVSDSGDVPLWNSPGLLMPSQGEQVVAFSPIAQRHLTDKLKLVSANDAALPVSLKFRCSSAGGLAINSKTLQAVYVARPLGKVPHEVQLKGDRGDLAFQVPAGLSPGSNSFKLTVRPKNLQRDQASPESPYTVPVQGLLVDQNTSVAAGVPFSGAKGQIAVARVFLAAKEASEAVLVVCGDAADTPGQPLGKPAVNSKVENTSPEWIDFAFPEPITASPGKYWLTLRTNKGSLLWFTDSGAAGVPSFSADKGKTWGTPASLLVDGQNLLAQLLSPLEPSTPDLTIRLQRDAEVLNANLLAGATATGTKKDISVSGVSLPSNLLSDSAAIQGKVEKRFLLASERVADVTIENFELTYDPAAGA